MTGMPRIVHNDPDYHALDPGCLNHPGLGHFCSGTFYGVASADGFVLLLMRNPQFGAHFRLTPDGARGIAQSLLNAAADMDAHNQAAADAQLGAVLAKKAPGQ